MNSKPQVALFVTCLVDLFRPETGFAAIRLLRAAGCEVVVPENQTCCGQVAINAGNRTGAAAIAKQVISMLEDYPAVVLPSGSCAGMLVQHYPELLASEPAWHARATDLSKRCFELTSWLGEIGFEASAQQMDSTDSETLTYHDSCSGLRELKIHTQPRALLRSLGMHISEMQETETCCGFGGTFCTKYPAISARLADDKLKSALDTGAGALVGGDLGCLLHLQGRADRQGIDIRCRHVAEVLAEQLDKVAPKDAAN